GRKNSLLRSTEKTSGQIAPSNSISNILESGSCSNFPSVRDGQIHLSQDTEDADFSPESNLLVKPELSNLQVNHSGRLDTTIPSVQKSEEDKDLQKKEDDRKEQEDEFVTPK